MPIDILVTLILTTVIQSLFGVGILLFGTPILLLLGYDFNDTLSVLLPVSITINLLQVIKHYPYIDFKLYKNILKYCIPFVVLFLFIITQIQFNIGLVVGIFLLFVALKDSYPPIEQALKSIMYYEKSYLVLMGVLHGMTNLGGSLLTALAHHQQQEKNKIRTTIAISYATFALFQLLTLFFIGYDSGIAYTDHMLLLQFSMIVFLVIEEALYKQIDNHKYHQLFAIFLAISGILLISKSLNT